MTNVLNLNPQNSEVEKVPSKGKIGKNEKDEPQFSFLSIMQLQLDKLNLNENSENTDLTKEKSKKSVNLTNLNNLSLLGKNKLNVELKNVENLNELKSAKNLQDLVKVANQKGLNIEKIDIQSVKDTNSKSIDTTTTTTITTANNKIVNTKKVETRILEKELNLELDNEKLTISPKIKEEKIAENKNFIANSNSIEKESLKQNIVNNGFSLESLLQKDENVVNKKLKKDKVVTETLEQNKLEKLENIESKKDISLDLKLDTNGKSLAEVEVKNKMVEAKSTINSFANTLKEQVENYKPPIMKLSLSLNPKELGNVDVTLISRGNSIQVNLASNSQAMQLFAQNAAEFKNALASIGFENVQMNFNSNEQSGQNNQNNQNGQNQRAFKYYSDNDLNFSAQELESLSSIDLTIPYYA